MPQVHNKALVLSSDSNAFSKTSRYMSTVRMTEDSKRRIRAFNVVENRLTRYKINFFSRHSEIEIRRRERETKRIVENLKKTLAYKLVLTKHSVTNARDYSKALNDNYSRHALRHDIKHMVAYMEPDKVRERQAKALIEENRKRYDQILNHNKKTIDAIVPPTGKHWRYYQIDEDNNKNGDYDDVEHQPTPPSPASRPLQSIIPSTRWSPTKPTLQLKRQGITKSFLLDSGLNTTHSIDIKLQNAKPDYELPPLQLQKTLIQMIKC